MNYEFELPKETFVNKFVAKKKFYEKTALSSKLINDFTHKIQKITWLYKLSENTIGISKTDTVTEIEIFEIELKEQKIPENILKVIDKTIPYQILYKFSFKDSFAYGITLKENRVITNYYFSEWNEKIDFDFNGIDLEKVYQKLITAFIPDKNLNEDSFENIIDTDDKIKKLNKNIELLKSKIRKENQFNRKVELNKELFELKKKLKNYEL